MRTLAKRSFHTECETIYFLQERFLLMSKISKIFLYIFSIRLHYYKIFPVEKQPEAPSASNSLYIGTGVTINRFDSFSHFRLECSRKMFPVILVDLALVVREICTLNLLVQAHFSKSFFTTDSRRHCNAL